MHHSLQTTPLTERDRCYLMQVVCPMEQIIWLRLKKLARFEI